MSTAEPPVTSSAVTKSSSGANRRAVRLLLSLVALIVGVLGITTLNGYAASGFSEVPNVFLQLFGSIISPLPVPPEGYVRLTPAQLQQDFSTGKDFYLGKKVMVYGQLLPWQDATDTDIKTPGGTPPVQPLKSRVGTITLSLFMDPTEQATSQQGGVRPTTVTVRVPEAWKQEHSGIQGHWVSAAGIVVAYSPSGGTEAVPEVEASPDDVRLITEPADPYDHFIQQQNPLNED